MILKAILITCTCLFMASCTGKNFSPLNQYYKKRSITPPTSEQFQSCRGYGCKFVDTITPSQKEWQQIDAPFEQTATTAEEEREQIAKSIAIFEQIVGEKTGTSEDVWGTFQKIGQKQQDCVDESTNTSIYMRTLNERGHINYHSVETPQSRIPLLKWPHQTAVLKENDTGQLYAIDSWFHNNGEEPEIIAFKTWRKGWKPDKKDTTDPEKHNDL